MAHYAKVIDGKVVNVIVAEPDFFKTFVDSSPGEWIQTSYNTRAGVYYKPDSDEPHEDQSKALRGNYAGIGYIYDRKNDKFYLPQPFQSWTLNKTSWNWEAPIPMPTDGNFYTWDETQKKWIIRS